MGFSLKQYKLRDFIRQTQNGTMDFARSLEAVRQLAQAADFHTDCHLLLDLRETESMVSPAEYIKLAMEFGAHQRRFHNKIAVIIPAKADRMEMAHFMQRCMQAEGYAIKVFTSYEFAIDWLAEVADLSISAN
jgi:hypothetical protein